MKSNKALGFAELARVGRYSIGQKGSAFRAYGYEWDSHQDVSIERAHHHVCGRGATAEEAIDKMIEAAIIAGQVEEEVHNCQEVKGLSRNEAGVLRRELKEAIAELADA